MTLTDEDRRAVVHLRMENARQTLLDAKLLNDAGSIRSAVNRAYYAMFYAASGLAIARGEAHSKHKGVVTLIHRDFVRTGRLGREHGRALQKAFENRSEGDYQDRLRFTQEDVAEMIRSAEAFIDAVAVLIPAREGLAQGTDSA